MGKTWEDLPEECWEAIFDPLKTSQHSLESLSLVCKRFLSISNRLRSSIKIFDRTILIPGHHRDLSRLFHRFRHLKRIHVSPFHGDLDRLILDISRSDLLLEAMDLSHQNRFPASSIKLLGCKMNTSMKTLICADVGFLDDNDLFVIGDWFPALEELDISCLVPGHGFLDTVSNPALVSGTVTDLGITRVSLKLRKLRSINISGNVFISDKSLMALSSNCEMLGRIKAHCCSFLTTNGINFILRHSSNLTELSVDENMIASFSPHTIECFRSYTRALHCLNFFQVLVPDELLLAIGGANLPLKTLNLNDCKGFTFCGISTLVRVYPSLHHLGLDGTKFLTDESMSILTKHLPHLISISLCVCTSLTILTFFNLANNCPSLKMLSMSRTRLGIENIFTDSVRNCRIRYLVLAENKYLTDETLKGIGAVCPELIFLDVSNCRNITGEGIEGIGKCCSEIMQLRVDDCEKVQDLGIGSKFLKLEILAACSSGIDDEGLAMIGWGCPRLWRLELMGCLGVTDRGLKALMGSDSGKVLKELNLINCTKVSADVLAWLVFTTPLLKKILVSSPLLPTLTQREMFLRHGCMVCDDVSFAFVDLEPFF